MMRLFFALNNWSFCISFSQQWLFVSGFSVSVNCFATSVKKKFYLLLRALYCKQIMSRL